MMMPLSDGSCHLGCLQRGWTELLWEEGWWHEEDFAIWEAFHSAFPIMPLSSQALPLVLQYPVKKYKTM